MLVWKLHGPVMHSAWQVAWTGHAQRMTGSCKNDVTATLANFGVYLWRKIPPQKI